MFNEGGFFMITGYFLSASSPDVLPSDKILLKFWCIELVTTIQWE